MYGPILKGKKSILRPPKISEAEKFVKWFNDKEVTRFLGTNFKKFNLKKEVQYLQSTKKTKDKIYWTIQAHDGHLIGSTSLDNISKEHNKATWGIAIGDKNYWGQGIGTDVLKTVLKYSFTKLKLNRVELGVFEGNIGGRKCYTRCGFIKEGKKIKSHCIQGIWHDEIIMAVLKEDYFKK